MKHSTTQKQTEKTKNNPFQSSLSQNPHSVTAAYISLVRNISYVRPAILAGSWEISGFFFFNFLFYIGV